MERYDSVQIGFVGEEAAEGNLLYPFTASVFPIRWSGRQILWAVSPPVRFSATINFTIRQYSLSSSGLALIRQIVSK